MGDEELCEDSSDCAVLGNLCSEVFDEKSLEVSIGSVCLMEDLRLFIKF